MTSRLPEPSSRTDDTKALFLEYLDFYRSTIEEKLAGLTGTQLRDSLLPSGWTPIQLLKHLVFMERRWLRWGFAAEPVPDPWGDSDEDGHWHVGPEESLEELLSVLREGGQQTTRIVQAADLDAPSRVGGRFESAEKAPALVWVLFHVLQEYARHAGHLDVVRELTDGVTGE
jgi:hypothetical protein